MLIKRPVDELRKSEYVNLSEAARLLNVARSTLKSLALADLFPAHFPTASGRRYYRAAEVKRVLKFVEPLRARGASLAFLRSELDGLAWYRTMRAEADPQRKAA